MCEACSQSDCVDNVSKFMFTNEDLNGPRCKICGKIYRAKTEFLIDHRFYNVCDACRMDIEKEDAVHYSSGRTQWLA